MKKILFLLTFNACAFLANAQETVLEDFNYTVTDQASFTAALSNFPLYDGPNWALDNASHWLFSLGVTATATNSYGLAGFPVGEKLTFSKVFSNSTGKGPTGTTPKDSIGGYIGKQIAQGYLTSGSSYKVKFDVSPARSVTYDVLSVELVEFTSANAYVGYTNLGTKTFTTADFGKKTIEYNIPLPTNLNNKFYLVFNHSVTQLDPANQTAGGYLGGLLLDKIILVKSNLSTDNFSDNDFSLSPNPATNFVSISNSKGVSLKNVEITDINGRQVKSFNYNNISETNVDVTDLTSGVYFMKINSDQGSVSKKFIKN